MHPPKTRLGISSCLLGNNVRFDGGHKHNDYITATLGQYFEFVPFCPEASAGLGIPRPPIHLVREPLGPEQQTIRLLEVRDHSKDHTDAIQTVSTALSADAQDLCGFILKKDSPSCGMERVKVYASQQHSSAPPERNGVGLFAAALKKRHPTLPLEEEGRLCDPLLRENFIQRVYVYWRWQQLLAQPLTARGLVEFHADHKYLIMAHDQDGLRELGQLVAAAGSKDDLADRAELYFRQLMRLLSQIASRGQHSNVLHHLLGYLRADLDSLDRAELVDTIRQYQEGHLPLIVPITLLRHHFRRHPHPYIERQHYLYPHPGELRLLNEV